MIPDFKTYIGESVWNDIRKRGNGTEKKKEDDVNLMDKDKFCEYLKSQYKVIVECKDPIGCGNSYIRLPLFVYPRTVRYILLYPKYNRIMVRTPYIEVWPDNLLDIIKTKYRREDTIDENRDRMTYIFPKEGEGNNEFFLDFIETILANVDKPAIEKKSLNESIWSDIRKRGNGTEMKKEDDINNLDMQGLLDYIQKKYEFSKEVITLSSSIGIPLFSHESSIVYLTISFTYSHDRIYDVYSRFMYDSPLKDSISSILKQKYSVKIRKENSMSKYDGRHFALISTKPKKGDIDNRFVIDVIDTYIDIMDTLKDIDKYITRK